MSSKSSVDGNAGHSGAKYFGAKVVEDGVQCRVWAPVAKSVDVQIVKGAEVLRTVPLHRDDAGYFLGRDAHGVAGDCYRYRLDDGVSYPDPASRWQPLGVHGPSMVIDPSVHDWRDREFARPLFRDLVIYELHIGTFTEEGTFRAAIERFTHLASLGVNAVEVMPVGDFAGDRNWGYDGVCLYAPARVYGTPDDFRAFVDAAHAAGIAVILDVVYNHFGPDGNYLAAYIGDYLDETTKTPWGGAIRYGSPEFAGLRELVVGNAEYWMEEFHIDGFRLDATHAISDASARHILTEITEKIHARGGYAIAEDNRNDVRLLQALELGGFGFDAVWADDFHHTVRVAYTGEREAYLADYLGTVSELAATLRDGWFYQGQPSQFQHGPRGTPVGDLAPSHFVHCISNHDQIGNRAFGERLTESISPDAYRAASALLCLTPYTPMLFMGQEWAATSPFLFFTDHEVELGKLITVGRREEFKGFKAFQAAGVSERIPDPQGVETFTRSRLRWTEIDTAPHSGMLELYRECLALRRSDNAFRPATRETWKVRELSIGLCALWLTSSSTEWLLLMNLNAERRGPLTGIPVTSRGGVWRRVLSTRETRFGGDGGSGVNDCLDEAHFDRPELVVLQSRNR